MQSVPYLRIQGFFCSIESWLEDDLIEAVDFDRSAQPEFITFHNRIVELETSQELDSNLGWIKRESVDDLLWNWSWNYGFIIIVLSRPTCKIYRNKQFTVLPWSSDSDLPAHNLMNNF